MVKVPKNKNLNINLLYFYMHYNYSYLGNTEHYDFGNNHYRRSSDKYYNNKLDFSNFDGYKSHLSFPNYDIYFFKINEQYSYINLYLYEKPKNFHSPDITFHLNEIPSSNYFLIEVPTDLSQTRGRIKCLDKNDILVTKYEAAEKIKFQKEEEEKISEQKIKKAKIEKILFFVLGITSLVLLVTFCTLGFGFTLIAAKIAISLIVLTAIASAVFPLLSVFFYNKVKTISKDFEEKIKNLNASLDDIQKNEINIFDTNASPNNNSQTQNPNSAYTAYMPQTQNNVPATTVENDPNPYSLPDNPYPF